MTIVHKSIAALLLMTAVSSPAFAADASSST